MSGILITFEGIEGCGKTTQLRLLAKELQKRGGEIVVTREPGGTAIGDQIRALLLNPQHKQMNPMTELLLYAAQRAQHVEEVIRPAIKRGVIVLCDRYTDATDAYQGAARSLGKTTLEAIHHLSTSGLKPNLTLLFDCPVELGLARAHERNEREKTAHESRFEEEKKSFHERVKSAYLDIARREPNRVKVIDATLAIDLIAREVMNHVEPYCRT